MSAPYERLADSFELELELVGEGRLDELAAADRRPRSTDFNPSGDAARIRPAGTRARCS